MAKPNEVFEYVKSSLMELYDGMCAFEPVIDVKTSVFDPKRGLTYTVQVDKLLDSDTLASRCILINDLKQANLIPKGMLPTCTWKKKGLWVVQLSPVDTPRMYKDQSAQLIEFLAFGYSRVEPGSFSVKGKVFDLDSKPRYEVSELKLHWDKGNKANAWAFDKPLSEGGVSYFHTTKLNQLDTPFSGLCDLVGGEVQGHAELMDKLFETTVGCKYPKSKQVSNEVIYLAARSMLKDKPID